MKPEVTMKLEGSNLRLALSSADSLFGSSPLNYVPWFLWDGERSYDFGFNNIRSRPVAEVVGWKFHSTVIRNAFRRSRAYEGVAEWVGPSDKNTVTVKWFVRHGPLASQEKLEAWIQHHTFKTWVVEALKDDPEVAKAQEVGRWYWNVRKDPYLIQQLLEKAHAKCSKPQRSVADAMANYRDRFHEAHKWDWFYQGCPTESLPDQFSGFTAFSEFKNLPGLIVPGCGEVRVKPNGWVSVPPFSISRTLPKPISDDGDDEVTNALLRIPTKRKC